MFRDFETRKNTAKTIAADLGGTVVTLLTEAKTLYHASAVVASNYLVTLLDPGEYDPELRKWRLDSLPFIPDDFKLKLIEKGQLNTLV